MSIYLAAADSATPTTSPSTAIKLSFVDAESRAAAEYAKVRIPQDRLSEWKKLFANGSTAHIVYDSESNVFLIIPAAREPIATMTPLMGTQTSDNNPTEPYIDSSPSPFGMLLIVTAAVIVVVVVLFVLVRKRFHRPHVPGLLSTMLASARRKSGASSGMLEDGLEHGWSEWSASSDNAMSACESPKRKTTNPSVLLSAQEAPKRVPLIIYEGEQ